MKYLLPLFLTLLSGCAALPKYAYQSQTSNDPVFVFGDRFGGGPVHSPTRTFAVNIKDAVSNKCADFASVGITSNNWIKLNSPTIEIKTPAGKPVSIRGTYLYGTSTCLSPVRMFTPKEGAIYSVDIETTYNTCSLSIVQKLPNGQQGMVDGITVLPVCKDK
jgi:hypothetical protein